MTAHAPVRHGLRVGDYQQGVGALQDAVQVAMQGLGVQGRKALVEDDEVGLLEQSPSDVETAALARAHQEQGNEAYALRLLGEIAAYRHLPEVEPAEGHYRQAIVLTGELGVRPLMAHCYLGWGLCMPRLDGESRPALNCPPPSNSTAP
jgi:hypothetical protein